LAAEKNKNIIHHRQGGVWQFITAPPLLEQRLSIPKWLIGCFVHFSGSPLIYYVGIHTKWSNLHTIPSLILPK
jgi:hypothetical protein